GSFTQPADTAAAAAGVTYTTTAAAVTMTASFVKQFKVTKGAATGGSYVMKDSAAAEKTGTIFVDDGGYVALSTAEPNATTYTKHIGWSATASTGTFYKEVGLTTVADTDGTVAGGMALDATVYFKPTANSTVNATFAEKPTLTLDRTTYDIGPGRTPVPDGITLTYAKGTEGVMKEILVTLPGTSNTKIIALNSTADILTFTPTTSGDAVGAPGTYKISDKWLKANLTGFTAYPGDITFTAVDTNDAANYNAVTGKVAVSQSTQDLTELTIGKVNAADALVPNTTLHVASYVAADITNTDIDYFWFAFPAGTATGAIPLVSALTVAGAAKPKEATIALDGTTYTALTAVSGTASKNGAD
ncbi:MAG: hypothetical protein RSB55_10335, partial [Oscillospiraceae bacterium]